MIRLLIFLFVPFFLTGQNIRITQSDTYERHTELRWDVQNLSNVEYFRIMRSSDNKVFSSVKTVTSATYMDFSSTDKLDTFYYYIEALSGLNQSLATSDTIQAIENTMTDAELMDMVQKYTFRYFWDEGHPVSGMARERNNSEDIVTTGGSGFGIMGILVGIENGYITRSEGANRIIKIISFLQYAEKFHGAFPHWMNGRTGKVVPFSQFDNGGDLVETAFLMQGLLAARQFFDVNNNTEKAIRQIITKLYEDVEWDWYSKNNSGVLYWHWSPNYAWQMNFPLRGYNEAMIVYLLAIASPTHSVPASYYHNGWAAANNYKNGNAWFGYKLFVGPAYGGPLFFAHYSFLGFDPRGIKDKYANYFENNRNHTLINRGWCIYNPLKHKKYSENSWGLTASDNPFGYSAHEPGSRDNGTIAPTAALSSMPYTPTESIAALRHFYLVEGESLFGPNGFYDAFNGDQNWVADSYLAIDQGPILVMLQNHRTELLWNMFMKNPEIKPALDAIGFVPDLTATSDANDIIKMALYPNPTTGKVKLVFDRERPNQIIIFDNTGNIVKNFKRMVEIESLDEIELIPSLYFIQANFEGNTEIIKLIVY
ncbi:MAG TPA: glucoamylase family protein [Saprospiraceae bacterium]|nr:T9SS type A sorting domain-containing protein [Saprospiraceae bacterium]MBK9583293.1 T9SS type A sorting domain-containing protein [Saprospiraceae bacterium]HRG40295.1 glucoamylase family protein [Saprospiraceae bacterium]